MPKMCMEQVKPGLKMIIQSYQFHMLMVCLERSDSTAAPKTSRPSEEHKGTTVHQIHNPPQGVTLTVSHFSRGTLCLQILVS